jgi:hypothetical protein
MKTTKPTSPLAPPTAQHINPIPRSYEIESSERLSQQMSWYYEDSSEFGDGDSVTTRTVSLSVTNVMQAGRSYSTDIVGTFARLMKESDSTH